MRSTKRTERYTDLRWAYFFKLIVFVWIATITIAQAKDLDSLLLSALTYLSGICFDFYIASHSNNGPVLKVRRIISKTIFIFLIVVIASLLAILLIDDMETIIANYSDKIYQLFKIIMAGSGVTGPLIELISNIPDDD